MLSDSMTEVGVRARINGQQSNVVLVGNIINALKTFFSNIQAVLKALEFAQVKSKLMWAAYVLWMNSRITAEWLYGIRRIGAFLRYCQAKD